MAEERHRGDTPKPHRGLGRSLPPVVFPHLYVVHTYDASARRVTAIDELAGIRRIKEEVEAQLLSLPGVTAIDIGTKYVGGKKTSVVAIRVFVQKKQDVPPEQTIPGEIQGVPTDVVERTFVLH